MRFLLTALLLFVWLLTPAQSTLYSRVKVYLDQSTPEQLGRLGFDLTHGHWHDGAYESDFSEYELGQLRSAGFRYEVLIENVQDYYVKQNEGLSNTINRTRAYTRSTDCYGAEQYRVPDHFRLGSMGGFFTYEEMLEHLDSMRILYPHLISDRQTVATRTIEGRDVYWWRISNNPDREEDEPEVFYNSVTHAREPGGMSQMIFFMWYLLENYESDPDIRQIVDHAQLYFMPCVNPDGYLYNQTNFPNGGGLWRKNKRDNNGDGVFEEAQDGVDLNRNFGYEWGFSDTGSSGFPGASTYRGTAPFSEPETQILRDFCAERNFRVALNYHTHGNLLIYPFSHVDTLADPDFLMAAELMTRENNYHAGTPTETVGYAVNGDVNDWMYGDRAIYAFAPEVGDGGFWPLITDIVPQCIDNVWQNLSAARLAMELTEWTPVAFEWELSGSLPFRLEHWGFEAAAVELIAEPLTANISFVSAQEFISLQTREVQLGAMNYILDPNIQHGDTVSVRMRWSAGGATWVDTLSQVYYTEDPTWADAGETLQNWDLRSLGNTVQYWSLTDQDYFSPPTCITDSPGALYGLGVRSVMTHIDPVELPVLAERVELVFYAKWDLEVDKDYVQVLIAPEGSSNFQPLCGLFTNMGVADQTRAEGEPLYDGTVDYWVREQIDLRDYLGERVRFRFVFQSDSRNDGSQGFWLDDLALRVVEEDGTTSLTNLVNQAPNLRVQPNPVREELQIQVDTKGQSGTVSITDVLGRSIFIRKVSAAGDRLRVAVSSWSRGIYFVQLQTANGRQQSQKVVVK